MLLYEMMFYAKLNRKTDKMGLTKENNYNEDELKFSAIAGAFGHPARRRIIDLVLSYNFVRNIDLPNYLNLHQSTVTQHINCLKKSGLIKCNYHIHFDILYLDKETLDYFQERLQRMSNLHFRET